jgi:hypothetical protein
MNSELAFRTQLKFPEHRQIFDYWSKQSAAGGIPSRRDIDPAAIREFLPDLCLIDIEDSIDGAVFRLAGTRIREIYGFEITGLPLSSVEWGDRTAYWQDIYTSVVEQRRPMHGAVSGPLAEREHIDLVWLRLPLSDDGCTVNKILCHDIAAATESHMKVREIESSVARVA